MRTWCRRPRAYVLGMYWRCRRATVAGVSIPRSAVAMLVFIPAALAAQSSIYRGNATNTSGLGPISAQIEIRFEARSRLHGQVVISAPLEGSGPFTGVLWSDSLLLRSEGEPGDTIFWLARVSGDSLAGLYIVNVGSPGQQAGAWSATRVSGATVVSLRRSARPVPDSVDLGALFRSVQVAAFGGAVHREMPNVEPMAPAYEQGAGDFSIGAWGLLVAGVLVAGWLASFGRDLFLIGRDRRVLLALVFVPGLYLTLALSTALILGVAGTVLFLFWKLAELIHRVPVGLMALVGIGAIYGIVSVLQGAAESVQKAVVPVEAVRLAPESAPLFFVLLQEVCAHLGSRAPNHVVLELGTSFFVTEAHVHTFEGPVKGRTLCISAPFLRILSIEELRAVIAHEMAHFTGSDTVYSRRFYPVYRGVLVAMQGMSSVTRSQGDNAAMMGCSLVLPLMFLGWYLALFGRLERSLGRSRELRADAIAAGATTPATMASALIKVHAFGPSWTETAELIVNAAKANRAYTNLSHFFGDWVKGHPEIAAMLAEQPDARSVHPTDTHPPLPLRLQNLGFAVDAAGMLPAEPEASSLFIALDASEERLTEMTSAVTIERARKQGLLGAPT